MDPATMLPETDLQYIFRAIHANFKPGTWIDGECTPAQSTPAEASENPHDNPSVQYERAERQGERNRKRKRSNVSGHAGPGTKNDKAANAAKDDATAQSIIDLFTKSIGEPTVDKERLALGTSQTPESHRYDQEPIDDGRELEKLLWKGSLEAEKRGKQLLTSVVIFPAAYLSHKQGLEYSDVCRDLGLGNLATLDFTRSELAGFVGEVPFKSLLKKEAFSSKLLTDGIIHPILAGSDGIQLREEQGQAAASMPSEDGGPGGNLQGGGGRSVGTPSAGATLHQAAPQGNRTVTEPQLGTQFTAVNRGESSQAFHSDDGTGQFHGVANQEAGWRPNEPNVETQSHHTDLSLGDPQHLSGSDRGIFKKRPGDLPPGKASGKRPRPGDNGTGQSSRAGPLRLPLSPPASQSLGDSDADPRAFAGTDDGAGGVNLRETGRQFQAINADHGASPPSLLSRVSTAHSSPLRAIQGPHLCLPSSTTIHDVLPSNNIPNSDGGAQFHGSGVDGDPNSPDGVGLWRAGSPTASRQDAPPNEPNVESLTDQSDGQDHANLSTSRPPHGLSPAVQPYLEGSGEVTSMDGCSTGLTLSSGSGNLAVQGASPLGPGAHGTSGSISKSHMSTTYGNELLPQTPHENTPGSQQTTCPSSPGGSDVEGRGTGIGADVEAPSGVAYETMVSPERQNSMASAENPFADGNSGSQALSGPDDEAGHANLLTAGHTGAPAETQFPDMEADLYPHGNPRSMGFFEELFNLLYDEADLAASGDPAFLMSFDDNSDPLDYFNNRPI
ncbi:hypothetical protein B0H63DRAFT_511886 [Podospora didyma]|uniref:Uncharacterized protein n=1 Tax=Podospora didyma TaxID=330526 RepID=A0AAE0KJJ6_9PEZI|nr:hypothetical protein B0H63DRAFT_511886 [Podospora didyma]